MSDGDEKGRPKTTELNADELAQAVRHAFRPDAPAAAAQDPVGPSSLEEASHAEPAWSEAFAEPERPSVEKIEACMAAGHTREAVLLCAALVDALLRIEGQDPAVAALLIGVSGPAWIRFQSTVRLARGDRDVPPALAAECFSFALSTSERSHRILARTQRASEI